MPKKTRKMKQRAAMRRSTEAMPQVIEREADGDNKTPVVSTPSVRPILSSTPRGVTPATYDYSHIYGDLKRIALFAGFFFAVLIVLSFVIK